MNESYAVRHQSYRLSLVISLRQESSIKYALIARETCETWKILPLANHAVFLQVTGVLVSPPRTLKSPSLAQPRYKSHSMRH